MLYQISRLKLALGGALIEMGVWLATPIAFLLWYTRWYGAPVESIGAHIAVVALIYAILAMLRFGIWGLFPHGQIARFVGTMLMSLALLLAWLYYILVVMGLNFWGRVISLELITFYSGQLFDLLNIIEISPIRILVILAASLAVTGFMIWQALRRLDWTREAAAGLSGTAVAFIFVGGAGIAMVKSYEFFQVPPGYTQEPLSLTLFASRFIHPLQGLGIDRAAVARRDKIEDRARENYTSSIDADRRNVIVIVVDALRPDRMGVFGHERETTPFISGLAEQGQIGVLANLHAVCAESACGMMAIFSARFPHELSSRPITLAEVLKLHGYRVHMIFSGDHTNFYGLKSMYGPADEYVDAASERGYYANDDQIVLDQVAGLPQWDGEPVLFKFHLMSAHNLGYRRADNGPYQPAANYAVRNQRQPEHALNFYDNGVYQTDAVIGELLDLLQDRGYLQKSVVVITGDHGEALGEHGHWSHANTVREAAIRIPVILIPNWGTESDFDGSIRIGSQVEIAPSILDSLGIAPPSTWNHGSIKSPDPAPLGFIRQNHEVGLLDYRGNDAVWKYWVNIRTGKEYAYELLTDPGENDNRIDEVDPEKLLEWGKLIFLTSGTVDMRDQGVQFE